MKSLSCTARSTGFSEPNRCRSASICSVTSSSLTAMSSTSASRPSRSGSVISGRTSTSAENCRLSLSLNSVTSTSGRPIALTWLSLTACE